MKVASRLAPVELENSLSGDKVRLGQFWEERAAVLIFLRHFG